MRKQVSNEEIKAIALQVLVDVADFCDCRGIRYYLVCGTALGAVRHDGFIPWDDDIDIGMPRPDYERFLSEYKSDKFYLCAHRFSNDYPYAFAKVCDARTELIENIAKPVKLGVYIDVFPIDGLPNDPNTLKEHLDRIRWDMRILAWKRISGNKKVGFAHKVVQVIAKAGLSVVPVSALVKKLDRDVQLYPYETADQVGHLITSALWGTDVKPKQVFSDRVKHRFEAYEFWLPGEYDEYLRLEYGDYMKLPPKEKQVNKHDFTVYWK